MSTSNNAWYALRRTLTPWRVDEGLPELVEYCRKNYVDEVIIKVDAEEFSHAMPTVEWLDAYMPSLRKIKSELEANGVVFSLNPWVTTVHCDRGRDLTKTFPEFDLIVGHDGTHTKACSCVLSQGWRRHIEKLWTRYASLNPDVLWIEDDIRLLNHAPARCGCFCDLHMAEFSKRVGHPVTREELVAALLAPGEPHPYRKEWLDMNGEIMNEVAGFFEKLIHGVSPNTRIGLMCSLPNHHAMEGRDWDGFCKALAGNKQLVARPCMGNYYEVSLRGLYESDYFASATMQYLGKGVDIQTEVENWPFTSYSKTPAFTFAQIALSFVMGADGVTMNMYDHMGTPLSVVPEYGEMLRTKKAYLNGLKERCYGGERKGVRLLQAPNGSYHIHVREGAAESLDYYALSPEGQSWRTMLQGAGFATTFEASNISAMTGQIVRGFTDAEIRQLLSGGLLLDLTAAECLIEMGYGDYVGTEVVRKFQRALEPLAAEEYFNAEFGGEEKKFMTLTLPDLGNRFTIGETKPFEDATVISRVVDPDCKELYPFVTLYQNELGGRVAVYPLDMNEAQNVPFLTPHRKLQFENVLRWLGSGYVPLEVDGFVWPLPFRIEQEGYSVVGAFNLTIETKNSAEFKLTGEDRVIKKIESLGEDGVWRTEESAVIIREEGQTRIRVNCNLTPGSLVALSVWWE